MKAIYLDCFSGISGNMLLGAFLQAGVPRQYLIDELVRLPLAGEFELQAEDVKKNGIQAVYVDVRLSEKMGEHAAGNEPHEHENHHAHLSSSGSGHVHRTMKDIREMLEESALSETVREKSLKIFEGLAEAEGKVHHMPKDEVHFHEVGAVDSIVDIVGTAICLDYLDVEKIFVSRLNVGSGFVKCAHGTMMVPAPATAELLKTFPFYHKGAERELTTPTGAAVVRAMAQYVENLPLDFVTEQIVYGAGTWDLDIPNVLRVYIGKYREKQETHRYLLETNIDDMNPQIYGYVYDRLFSAGALDVWTTSIFMKKNRPAQKLSVLVDETHKEECCDIIFTETSSIGLRILPVEQRREAMRRMAHVETKYGAVDCKVSAYKGKIVSLSAEYEDCRRLAAAHKVPFKVVQQEALRELKSRLGE